MTYYRADLARAHHLGFGFHADRCAPGILRLLEPVLDRGGLVVELGCGSGLLTRHLVDAGHRVLATDASPAMLALAQEHAAGAEVARLTLPDDPIPPADAVVSVGHALNYLDDEAAVERALDAAAAAVRPGGILALDLCDLAYGATRSAVPNGGWVSDDWAMVTAFSTPTPERFVRQITVFQRNEDGSWRRDDERHVNVLLDTSTVPERLRRQGFEVSVGDAFGDETLPAGLRSVVARREPVRA